MRLAGHGRESLLTLGFSDSVADAEIGNSNDGLLSHSLYYARSTRCFTEGLVANGYSKHSVSAVEGIQP
jgi:hypothetical protein